MLKKNKLLLLFLFILFSISTIYFFNFNNREYGVFIGVGKDKLPYIKNYNLIVIDAQYYTKQDIIKLKSQGNKKIFSYLNVGSLENFRDYYDEYKDIIISSYEHWDEEFWIDISDEKWQKHILNTANLFKDKGIDGLFLDNLDIYYVYKTDLIYKSLLDILTRLQTLKIPIIINGADTFVKKALDEKKLDIYGINQENVFTKTNFESKKFDKADEDSKKYFLDYLKQCNNNKITVFLTEYTKDMRLKKQIKSYCKSKNYICYISSTIELNKIE